MSKSLKIKDFVTIGIFTVIYFVLMFTIGMMGVIPILMLVYPGVFTLVAGTLIMLFMAKVPKPWALFILGMLTPVIMTVMGHHYVILLYSLVCISIAEFLFRRGNFKSFKYNALSYSFFSMALMAGFLEFMVAKDSYKDIHIKAGMSPEYFDKLETILSNQTILLVGVSVFVAGLIGAYIGKLMLKKHFERAGIV